VSNVQLRQNKYPLAKDSTWWALQGEGHLRGFQMLFIRLAGCSVGCAECDTDYDVHIKVTLDQLMARAMSALPLQLRERFVKTRWMHGAWVWITGGNPADLEMRPLLDALTTLGFSTAAAVSGDKRFIPPVNWLSVSSHSKDLLQTYGNELKVVDGLNGLDLNDWYEANPDSTTDFMYRYVQPLWIGDAKTGHECPESMARCLEFLKAHPNWALSRQDHKHWSVP
jgi:7-carboxy-7-deazaguanine synthase